MYFIKVNDACLNVLGVVYFIRELLKIAYIVVPAGLIVMISFDFVKGVISFSESSTQALIYVVKRLINSMLIFLIPSLVFTLFYILDFTSNDTKACWNYIDEISVTEVRNVLKTKREEIEKNIKIYESEIAKDLIGTDPPNVRIIVESKSNTDNEGSEGTVIGQKYNLTSSELKSLAYLASCEQGSPEGAAAEASLMANRFEMYGGKYKSLIKYVRNSGWFAHSKERIDHPKSVSSKVKAAVKDVLVNGNRTLPLYIDEHDYFGDISKIVTGGSSKSTSSEIKKRKNYKKEETKIYNRMGAEYTFYSFPAKGSDPFGYTDTAKKKYKKLNK